MAAYVDASFAKEVNRKSQTGFALFMAGAAFHSKSGKQSQVTDSTGYAETIALHEVTNWTLMYRLYLSRMFAAPTNPTRLFPSDEEEASDEDTGSETAILKKPTRVFEDNDAAVAFAKNGPGQRSLHWDVKCEYICEQEKKGKIDVTPIATDLQIADVLTKPLPWDRHLKLAALLLGNEVIFST
jgi:hypothetical protein